MILKHQTSWFPNWSSKFNQANTHYGNHFNNLVPSEHKFLQEYIDENLTIGFILKIMSRVGSQILFTKNKDGSLHFVVDFWGLDKLISRNKYSLPLISTFFWVLEWWQMFHNLNLQGPYNLVGIHRTMNGRAHFTHMVILTIQLCHLVSWMHQWFSTHRQSYFSRPGISLIKQKL